MSVAIINFSFYFWYQTEVVNAAQAGAQWAINNAGSRASIRGIRLEEYNPEHGQRQYFVASVGFRRHHTSTSS